MSSDNDVGHFPPKLSLTPLDVDLATSHPTETLDSKPEKVICPKCGYQAKNADDPLLTKHQGLGECLKCGVIPKNYLSKNEIKKLTSNQNSSHSHVNRNITENNRNEWILKAIIFASLFVGLAILILMIKPSANNATPNDAAKSVTVTNPQPSTKAMNEQRNLNLEFKSGISELKNIREDYWQVLREHKDLDSLLDAAETAASAVTSARKNLNNPAILKVYDHCNNALEILIDHLRWCKQLGRKYDNRFLINLDVKCWDNLRY